jgi:hypothetical protein
MDSPPSPLLNTAANSTPRCICPCALSFFAVGARLARERSTAVYLPHRVIVLRGRASLLRANNPPRFTCPTASSFFAGKPRSYGRTIHRGLPAPPRHRFSRASLAPTGEQSTAVYLPLRVIVLRGRVHPITNAEPSPRPASTPLVRHIPGVWLVCRSATGVCELDEHRVNPQQYPERGENPGSTH